MLSLSLLLLLLLLSLLLLCCRCGDDDDDDAVKIVACRTCSYSTCDTLVHKRNETQHRSLTRTVLTSQTAPTAACTDHTLLSRQHAEVTASATRKICISR